MNTPLKLWAVSAYTQHSTIAPVITCPGDGYHSRGAASILYNIGLPELVMNSPQEYKEKIIYYIKNPEEYKRLKEKLIQNKKTEPLFNTKRFAKHFEKACELMWQRYQEGLEPDVIQVPKIDA